MQPVARLKSCLWEASSIESTRQDNCEGSDVRCICLCQTKPVNQAATVKSRQLRRTTIFHRRTRRFPHESVRLRQGARIHHAATHHSNHTLALVTEQTADQDSRILCPSQTFNHLHDATLRPHRPSPLLPAPVAWFRHQAGQAQTTPRRLPPSTSGRLLRQNSRSALPKSLAKRR